MKIHTVYSSQIRNKLYGTVLNTRFLLHFRFFCFTILHEEAEELFVNEWDFVIS